MTMTAREYWTEAPFTGVVRQVPIPEPAAGEVLVETEVSGISSGTESLVHRGEVPASVSELMRAPHQLGEFPSPVSHGYLNVGIVKQGPAQLLGKRVFSLSGHRSHVVIPAESCHVIPDDCPSERALLAGIAEVALNAIWEAQVTLADRVTVIGAGMVGLSAALLLSRIGLQRLEVVEVDAGRRDVVESLGLTAVTPEDASGDNDVVFHTSAHEAGLARALEITGDDGAVLELSWYGQKSLQVPLGADFHARRLRIIGSQVGQVASPKRLRRTRAERLSTALALLDERFDALITGRSPLEELPAVMDQMAGRGTAGPEQPLEDHMNTSRKEILHVVTY